MPSNRWFPFKVNTQHAAEQLSGYLNSRKRFNVLTGGRRQYKTEGAKRKGVWEGIGYNDPSSPWYLPGVEDPNFAFIAPTHEQAYRIFWNDLNALIPRDFILYTNIQRRVIHLKNGCNFFVLGADMAARLEGVMWHKFKIDEFPNIKEEVWFEHLRPCLSDTIGTCDFLGVPEGKHNHFYKMWCLAGENKDDFDRWHWTSAEVLSPKEVEAAKREYDPATFRQEYEGSFENYQGRAYYQFDRDVQVKPHTYDPKAPLWIALDFNVSPGICIIGQYYEKNGLDIEHIIDEVYVPSNSTTEKICGLFIQRYFQHQGIIEVDGDATGGAHDTTSGRTDWEIVRSMMDSNFGRQMRYHYPMRNPHERDRVNAVNARLMSLSGDVRMLFDPKARYTIDDFDKTTLNDKGEIDKKTNLKVSHCSDAVGYRVSRKYPIKKYAPSGQKIWK